MTILAPRCPGCDCEPVMLVDTVAFCGCEGCQVLSWDMTKSSARFKAYATTIDLAEYEERTPRE